MQGNVPGQVLPQHPIPRLRLIQGSVRTLVWMPHLCNTLFSLPILPLPSRDLSVLAAPSLTQLYASCMKKCISLCKSRYLHWYLQHIPFYLPWHSSCHSSYSPSRPLSYQSLAAIPPTPPSVPKTAPCYSSGSCQPESMGNVTTYRRPQNTLPRGMSSKTTEQLWIIFWHTCDRRLSSLECRRYN